MSQSSAATDLRRFGRVFNNFLRNSCQNATVKELLKLVHIYESCHKNAWAILYDSQYRKSKQTTEIVAENINLRIDV